MRNHLKTTALAILHRYDARNPHVLEYTLRFLRFGTMQPSFARYVLK